MSLDDAEEVDVWNQRTVPTRPRPKTPPPGHAVVTVHADADNIMRVSASSPPQAVASSIRAVIFERSEMPVIRAIGAGAVAQACKGIAIARGHVAVSGRDLATTIGFETVPGDSGQDISAQVFHLFLR
jgi:stage V sporulation protein S